MSGPSVPGVAFVSLGCRVNRVETDAMMGEFAESGYPIVPQGDAALVVVNTCAVTGEAQAKTRKAVRHAASLPQHPLVIATGCVANLFAAELQQIAPNIVVEPDKELVASRGIEALRRLASKRSLAAAETPRYSQEATTSHIQDGACVATPTPTGRLRPGIKVQDGCDNRCTYCIVWKARGPSRSVPSDQVVRAVRKSVMRGAYEVVLTGINIGCYRTDPGDVLGAGAGLPELLDALLRRTEVQRLRVSSIEPPDVTPELLDVMASSGGRVAPFLHVCLQSGSDETLRRMGRVYDTDLFASRVALARDRMPDLSLGTDLIVGFPGESAREFSESFAFCRRMGFSNMHVFRYSRRPGTPAASFEGQVPPQVSAERAKIMRQAARSMRLDALERLVGKTDDVIVEHVGQAVDSHLYPVSVSRALPVGSVAHVRFSATAAGMLVGS